MEDSLLRRGAAASLSARQTAVALAPVGAQRTVLTAAAVGAVRLDTCDRVAEVRRHLRLTGATMLIARPRDADDVLIDMLVEELQRRVPRLVVVVIAPHNDNAQSDVRALQRVGLADVFFEDDGRLRERVAALVDRASFKARLNGLADRAAQAVPPALRAIVRFIIENGERAITKKEICRALGISPRTLSRRCERAGRPPPRQLIMWGRLVAAGVHLDSSLAAVERIALELGFDSHSGMCGYFHRYMASKPTDIREKGADFVLEKMMERIAKV